jgi:hypothetical protein
VQTDFFGAQRGSEPDIGMHEYDAQTTGVPAARHGRTRPASTTNREFLLNGRCVAEPMDCSAARRVPLKR